MINVTETIAIAELGMQSVLMTDGSISIGYRLTLPEEGTLSKEDYTSAVHSLHRTLSILPDNTVVQQLDIFYDLPYKIDQQALEKAMDAHDFFKVKKLQHYQDKPVLQQESYLFLNFRDKNILTGKDVRSTHLASIQTDTKVIPCTKNITQQIEAFESLITEPFAISKLQGEEILQLLYRYVNLNLKDQPIAFNALSHSHEGVMVGKTNVGIVSMESQAPLMTTCRLNRAGVPTAFMQDIYNTLNFPHIVSKALRIENNKEILDKALKEGALISEIFLRPSEEREAQRRTDDVLELEETLSRDEEKITSLSLHVIAWDEEKRALNSKLLEIQNAFTNAGIASSIETSSTLNLFLGAAPACGGQLYKGKAMPLKTAVAYSNFTSPRKGSKKGIILADRHGAPLKYDPFNFGLDNQNAFVFGPSGSGKSFFNAKMIKDRYDQGHTLIVIDSGGTYRRLFEALGGKFIEYNLDKPLNLNPFLVPKEGNRWKASADKIDFLSSFIGKIWKGDLVNNPMSEAEKALLSEYLTTYYQSEQGEVPSLRSFVQWLGKQKKKKAEEELFNFQAFEIILKPFVTGIHSEHFNSDTLDYLTDYHLICFELETIKNNPKLYPLLIQVLFDYAFEIVAKRPTSLKFIDVEEGWAMLDDVGEEYIEALFRKGRKTRTSIRLITQDINEVKNSRIAGALKNNASTFMLLYNEKESSREEASEWLGLNELEMSKYASLQRRGGKKPWREILIKEMDQSAVWRIETSPYEYALLTSRPDERDAITQLTQTKPLEQAIIEWVNLQQQKWN